MRNKKLNYEEGSCFVFPLDHRGFARGVVARMNRKGRVFGYFFGPRLMSLDESNYEGLTPDKAILRGDFGDLGLLQEQWKVFGRIPQWKRDEWPLPPMIRVDESSRRAWLSWYDEKTFACIKEMEVSPDLVDQYPYDRTMGYKAVETRIAKLLQCAAVK